MTIPTRIENLLAVRLPRYDELPNIGLYKDQVLELVNSYLGAFYATERPMTDTMVNNYVKLKVIAAPIKKRYNRFQLAQLLMTCLLKKVLSIAEVRELLSLYPSEARLEEVYNRFCQELEDVVSTSFQGPSVNAISVPFLTQRGEGDSLLMSSAIGSFACKLYFEVMLEHQRQQAKQTKEA